MKAAVVYSLERILLEERPVPKIGPGEILVSMKAVGLCGSDISPWYVATKAPAVLGHETAGEVVETGPGVSRFKPGDRVFVHHHAPCGTCRSCRRGDAVMCAAWKPNQLDPGGLAEFVRVLPGTVAADTLILPKELDFEDGALIEPVACCVKAVNRARLQPGDTVLVVGLGSNGILLGLLARHQGADLLIGSDPDPARRQFARDFGFDYVFDSTTAELPEAVADVTSGRLAEGVFVIPTAKEAALGGVECAAPGGTVVFYSPIDPEKVWPLAPSRPYFCDLTLTFSYSSGPAETMRALELIRHGVIRAERLVTHRFGLGDVAHAFRLAAFGGEVLKVMIRM